MSETAKLRATWAALLILFVAAWLFTAAAWKQALSRTLYEGQYADETPERRKWFSGQEINPEAQKRLGVPFKSCCDAGDVYKTRFRLVEDGSKYGAESYEYLREGTWKIIPPDIVRVDKTPDGRPVLFINKNTGMELCFIIDETGI